MIRLDFAVPETAEGRPFDLGAFDVSGRRVAQLASGVARTGRYSAAWNPKADADGAVRPGIYFIRLRLGEEQRVRVVTIAH
jgi:hypothetical protein